MSDVATDHIPFNDSIGLTFDRFEGEDPVWRFEPSLAALASHEGARLVHGGATAGCIEIVGAHAVYAADPTDSEWVPVDMRTDFHRLMRPGVYRVRSRAVRVGRRSAVADVEIEAFDSARAMASGRVVLVKVHDGYTLGQDEAAVAPDGA